MKFPLNYFASILSPTRCFAGRKNLNWFQALVTLIFLNALLVIPVTLYYAVGLEQIPVANFLGADAGLLTTENAAAVQQITVADGQLTTPPLELVNTVENKTYRLAFLKDTWQVDGVVEGKAMHYEMRYPSDFNPQEVTDRQSLANFLEKNFYRSNRPVLILSYSLSLGVMLFAMSFLLIMGGAFFLWLTRKSKFSDIGDFRQGFNLMLNVFGLPTLLAMVVGLVHFDFVWMLSIQTFGGVLLLLAVYAKTKFKDAKE